MDVNSVPRSPITGVPGWHHCDDEELLYIQAASRVKDSAHIVEVGCEYGRATAAFLYGIAQGKRQNVTCHCVDLFPGTLRTQHEDFIMPTYARYKLNDLGMRIVYHVNSSVSAAAKLTARGDMRFSLLLIDADHHYDAVQADIAAWLPLAAPSATVLFHDCAPPTNVQPHVLHFEVQRAVDEWYRGARQEGWREQASVCSVRWFVREAL